LMRASLDRLAPIREAKRDIARLEERLSQLEGTLSKLDKAATGSRGIAVARKKAPAPSPRKTAGTAPRKAAPPATSRGRSAQRSPTRTAPRAGKAS